MQHDGGAEGWFVDPYGRHEHRWFSAGTPSSLVRDGGIESADPPPDDPYDEPLARASGGASPRTGGDDLRRVGDDRNGSYDPLRAFDAVLDGTTWFPTN